MANKNNNNIKNMGKHNISIFCRRSNQDVEMSRTLYYNSYSGVYFVRYKGQDIEVDSWLDRWSGSANI